MPDLNVILDLLDERTVARQVSLRHYLAEEQYELRRIVVESFPEFHAVLVDFYKHCFAHTVSPGAEMPTNLASGYAWQIVEKSYRGGMEEAFRAAKYGIVGGLPGVLSKIAAAMRQEQEEAYINFVLRTHVDPLSWEEVVELMRQYLARFGSFLPADAEPRSAEQLAGGWEDLVKTHAKVLSSMRARMGRM